MSADFLNKILQSPTVFIIGEEETLNRVSLNFIFKASIKTNIHKYYFINANDYLSEFLDKNVETKDYSILPDLPDFKEVSNYNLIISGVKPASNQLLRITQKSRNKIAIFFSHKIGMLISNFSKASIVVSEDSFNHFVSENTALKKEPSSIPLRHEKDFFTNRTFELKDLTKFTGNIQKRGCKILGIDSIGKSAFLIEAKSVLGLKTNCYEHTFLPKGNSHVTLIESLFTALGIKLNFSKIKHTRKDKYSEIYKQFFTEVDKIQDAKIIFHEFQYLINVRDGKFPNREILSFIEQLLNRNTYKGNKVYFISNQNFRFATEIELLCDKIELRGLDFDHIKRILQNEFSQMGKKLFADEIMRRDEDDRPIYDKVIINELTNGNPQIAKMFAKQVSDEGLGSIHTYINDIDYRKKFDAEKIEFLLKKLNLEGSEKKILNLLCLVKYNFDKEFFKKVSDSPIDDLRKLKDRFLLEVNYYKNGESYYIPRIVQSCILSGINCNTIEYKNDNNLLGNTYWDLANSIAASPFKHIEYYNRAEYHFSEAENFEKTSLLILERNEIYLLKAEELYDNFKRREAWQYYNELYKNGIEFSSHQLLHYIVCNTQLKKAGTNELYINAITQFEKDTYIFNSYANYLVLNNGSKEARKICEKMRDDKIDNKATANILSRAIHQLGGHSKAINIIKSQIDSYPKSLRDNEKELLINDLMTYFKFLISRDDWEKTYEKVVELAKKDELYVKHFENFREDSLPEFLARDIEVMFDLAMKNKNADKILCDSYSNFLERQRNFKKLAIVKGGKQKLSANTFKIWGDQDVSYNDKIGTLIEQQFSSVSKMDVQDQVDDDLIPKAKKGKADDTLTKKENGEPEVKINKTKVTITDEISKEKLISSANTKEIIKGQEDEINTVEAKDLKSTISKKIVQNKQAQNIFKYSNEIFDIIHSFEQKVEAALNQINRIISLDNDNFRALHTKCTLLIAKSEAFLLKKIMNENYSLKQKIYSMDKVPEIFISYSHEDKAIAEKVLEMLKSHYLKITIDSSMLGSKDIKEFIEETISKTDITLAIVSKSSLMSSWVGMETINTFYRNKFNDSKKLLACYTDDSIFRRNFVVETVEILDKHIIEINELIQKQTGLNIDTRNLNNEKTRYLNLKNNIDEFVRYFKESISIDIRGEKLELNFQKILDSILT